MLSENPTLDEVKTFFSQDCFATQTTGCRIIEAAHGHALTELYLTDSHRNAMGKVMGGAIFTLADFALAIACNIGEKPTVSVDHTISFFTATKGTKLLATATCDKSGKHLGFYTIKVTDDLGKDIAKMTATCYR